MFWSVNSSLTGLRGFQQSMDQTSDNIANTNTTGHKKSEVSFNDLLYRELSERRMSESQALEAEPPQTGKGTRVSATNTNFAQGGMEQTNRPLDLAVEGEGLFRVIREDGTEAYTRDGTFFMDAEGDLVNASGDYLDVPFDLSEYMVDTEEGGSLEQLTIDERGNVYWQDEDEAEPEELGQIELHRFVNPEGLEQDGNNQFLETEVSGAPITGTPGEDGFGQLRQGFIERSNVDMAEEMTNLIKDQRALQSNARAMTTSDELWSMTLQAKA